MMYSRQLDSFSKVVVVLLLLQLWASNSDYVDFKKELVHLPTSDAARDVHVLFVAGAGFEAKQYTGILQNLQKLAMSTYGLGISITSTSIETLEEISENTDIAFATVKRHLEDSGLLGGVPLFYGGHSAGGVLSISAAREQADGLVLLGATMAFSDDDLHTYPKSTLTLLGELDGYLPQVYAADQVQATLDYERVTGAAIAWCEKPVIVLLGVAHQQFADGTQTEVAVETYRRDFTPEVTLLEAWNAASEIISAFIALNVKHRDRDVVAFASAVMMRAKRVTLHIVESYLFQLTEIAEVSFAKWVQHHVAVEELEMDAIIVTLYEDDVPSSVLDFTYSEPLAVNGRVKTQLMKGNDGASGIAFSSAPDQDLLHLSPLGAELMTRSLALKLLCNEGVSQVRRSDRDLHLKKTASAHVEVSVATSAVTAQMLNKWTLQHCLDLVSPVAFKRYAESNISISFQEDHHLTSIQEWLNHNVTLEVEVKRNFDDEDGESDDGSAARGVIRVRSPVLYSSASQFLSKEEKSVGEVVYMKVLTPAQGLELILVGVLSIRAMIDAT